MTPDTSELLAALPEEVFQRPDAGALGAEIDALFARLARRTVPTGRIRRLWILGTLQARLAAGYAAWWARGLLVGAEERERSLAETHLRAGIRLLGSMGYLRGIVQKFGQTLASTKAIVPDQIADVLAHLSFEAPPMHFSLLREHLRGELGADPEEIFADFEPKAVAAASLGQVHRARLRDGRRVAVKIQYPGIAGTIRADLANLRALLAPLRLTRDWDNLVANIDEIRATMEIEADYRREADYADRVRASLAELTDVVVPEIHRDLSTSRVLTMEWIEGLHAPALVASAPPQSVLDHHAAQVMRVSARTWYSDRLLLADPNPGNFLFLADGRLGLVDFGCCREFVGEEWAALLQVIDAGQGAADLRETLGRCALLTAEETADDERMRLLTASCEWLWEPLRVDGPFDFGDPDYLRRGFTIVRELAERRYLRTMPVWTWSNRLLYGVRSLAYQMRARVDLGRINAEELERAGLLVR